MDLLWMREAYRQLNANSAVGVDGESVAAFGERLDERLTELLEQAKSGSYRAPPVLRKQIPKNEKETRPIGIPTTANKVLERAVVMLLEPIYEQDFIEDSYGFRRNRSSHDALEVIRQSLMQMGGGWVLDVDVQKYFDTIQHGHLRDILRKRVKDGVILRLINKWLKAGVWENGQIEYSTEGTPQGGVVSPMLSNIYLNEVLDQWFTKEVQPHLQGKARLVRFADDFVMLFEHKADAEQVKDLLPERFGQFGLTIHPEKTRLVDFRRPDKAAKIKPQTFDFLGFTHYWGTTRKKGKAVKKKTAGKKMQRAVRAIDDWCKANRHERVHHQHATLSQKIRGHYAYYGVTGNSRALGEFLDLVRKSWRKWLNRRNHKRGMPWDRYNAMLRGPYALPPPRIIRRSDPQTHFAF
jgi:group II intron reverse transcriptase/maturase